MAPAMAGPTLAKMLARSCPMPFTSSRTWFQSVSCSSAGTWMTSRLPREMALSAGPMVDAMSARYPVTPLMAPVTSSRPKSCTWASRLPMAPAMAGPTLAKMLARSCPMPFTSSRTWFQSVSCSSAGTWMTSRLPREMALSAGPMVDAMSARYPVTPLIAPVTSSRPKSCTSGAATPRLLRSEAISL